MRVVPCSCWLVPFPLMFTGSRIVASIDTAVLGDERNCLNCSIGKRDWGAASSAEKTGAPISKWGGPPARRTARAGGPRHSHPQHRLPHRPVAQHFFHRRQSLLDQPKGTFSFLVSSFS